MQSMNMENNQVSANQVTELSAAEVHAVSGGAKNIFRDSIRNHLKRVSIHK